MGFYDDLLHGNDTRIKGQFTKIILLCKRMTCRRSAAWYFWERFVWVYAPDKQVAATRLGHAAPLGLGIIFGNAMTGLRPALTYVAPLALYNDGRGAAPLRNLSLIVRVFLFPCGRYYFAPSALFYCRAAVRPFFIIYNSKFIISSPARFSF